ncbi:MAG TPA: isopeptide-forming domain-containing fimbrial protein [Conexibacter sp.]|jgi:uncharacterized repeat protein (TIGR01451 family)/fimbrial isopeptide formation D2 family protein
MSRPRALACTLTLLAVLLGLLTFSAAAQADPVMTMSVDSPEILHGDAIPIHVEFSNDAANIADYAYNLTFSVVLPSGVTYNDDAPIKPTVIPNAPSPGLTTLVFSNVTDLSPRATYGLSFTAHYNTSTYDVGGTPIVIRAQGGVNSAPRVVPAFDANGLNLANATQTTGPQTGTVTLKALRVDKDEPSAEGEIMRGVHDDQTTYTLTVRNNRVNSTDNVTVVDYLPAGLEYLGCGAGTSDDDSTDHTTDAPTNSGSNQEYPGSGAIDVRDVTGCRPADSVETVDVDPDGSGPPAENGNGDLPAGVYTKVTWNLSNLTPGQVVRLPYGAAIPIRENVLFPAGSEPARTGAQATNLDNNSGAETHDEQLIENYATADGTYHRNGNTGTARAPDETWLSRKAEDWVVHKSADRSELDELDITTWRLDFQTSEYRSVKNATVSDTVPSGLCPIDATTNHTSRNSTDDSECDGVLGDAPDFPYSNVLENSDGTFTVTWNEAQFPQLAQTGVKQSFSMTYKTVTRTHYQDNFLSTTPILTRDPIVNRVHTDATEVVRCTAPDPANCNGAASANEIDHDAADDTGRTIIDDSEASEVAPSPRLTKLVADNTGIDFSGANKDCTNSSISYVRTEPVYHPGDFVCWDLMLDFASQVDTNPLVIRDFLPTNAVYEDNSDSTYSTDNIGTDALLAPSPGDDGMLEWSISSGGGTTVPIGGKIFNHVIGTTVFPAGTPRNDEITGNLLKFSSVNTAQDSEPLRDQRDIALVTPIVDVVKGVASIDRRGSNVVTGLLPNNDDQTIESGDDVTYRLDLTNSGGQDAVHVEVWDRLPAEYRCSFPGVRAISPGGTCVPGAFNDMIEWTGITVPANTTLGNGPSLTYTATAPADLGPRRALDNTAGVVGYDGETNQSTVFHYTPANDIDGTPTTSSNAPQADDTSKVVTAPATVVKSATSTVNDSDDGNLDNQATIGEQITYTVRTTVPAGTTLHGRALLTDAFDDNARQTFDGTGATATLNGTPVDSAFVLDQSGTTPTLTFPADFSVPEGDPDAVVVLTFTTTVTRDSSNVRDPSRSNPIENSARLDWTDPVRDALSDSSNVVSTQVVEPNLTQDKTDDTGGARVSPGDIVRYVATTTNDDSVDAVSTAYNVKIRDVVPAGLELVDNSGVRLNSGDSLPEDPDATWTPGATNTDPGVITETVPELQPGIANAKRVRYSARVKIPAVGGSSQTNTVDVTGESYASGQRTSTDGVAGYSATKTDTIRIAGAQITKEASLASATIGQQVRYALTVTIPADIDLFDVTVEDTLPDGIAYDGNPTITCDITSDCSEFPDPPGPGVYNPTTSAGRTTIAFDFGDITALASQMVIRVTYSGHVLDRDHNGNDVVDGHRLTNGAIIGTDETNLIRTPFNAGTIPPSFDDTTGPVTRDVTVIEPRLAVDKRVSATGSSGTFSDGPLRAQADVDPAYQLRITNNGDSPAFDGDIVDTPNANLTDFTITDITPPIGTEPRVTVTNGGNNGQPMTFHFDGPLDPGDSVRISYTARAVAAAGLTTGDSLDGTVTVPDYFGVPSSERTDSANSTVTYRDYRDVTPDSTSIVLAFPTLTLTKTTGLTSQPDTGAASVNTSFPWEVVVANSSADASARAVEVTDTLPQNWSYDNNSATLNGAPLANPTITADAAGDRLVFQVGPLAAGTSARVDYRATPSTAAGDTPGRGPEANVNTAGITAAQDAGGNTADDDGPYAGATDTATATLDAPALTIAKTPDGAAVTAGDNTPQQTFDVTIENSGAIDANNVVVRDVMPAGLVYTAGTASSVKAGTPSTGFSEGTPSVGSGTGETTVVWTLGTVEAGGSVTIRVPVDIRADVPDGTHLVNSATLTSSDLTNPISDEGSLDVSAVADVSITNDGPPRYTAGTDYTWTLDARDNGPSDAQNVLVSDPLPARTRFVSVDNPDCSYDGAARTVRCDFGTMAVGAERTIAITVHVDPSTTTDPLIDTGTVSTTTSGDAPGNNVAASPTEADPYADVTITKTADPASIGRGSESTFALTVGNSGPSDAQDVRVEDVLPAELEFVSADNGCTETAGTIDCLLGTVAAGGHAVAHVTVRGDVLGRFVNNAHVSTTTPEPQSGGDTNDAQASVEVDPVTDLAIDKSGPATVEPGSQLTWDLLITNNGPDDATGVTVSDPLPAGVAFTAAGEGCTPADGTVTCAVGDLAAGASVTRQVTATVPVLLASTTIVNTASVAGDQLDPNPDNNRDDASTTVNAAQVTPPPPVDNSFDLSLQNRVQKGSKPQLGGTFGYVLTATESGPGTATAAVVTDTVPAGLQPLSAKVAAGSSCTVKKQVVTCPLGDMAPASTRTITVQAKALKTGTVKNTAVVSSSAADRDPANDTASATTKVTTPRASLKLVKRALGRSLIARGGNVRFRVTVTNTSASLAADVTVCDQLPDGLTVRAAGSGKLRHGQLCWTVGTLKAHAAQSFAFTAHVLNDARGPRIANGATVTASNAATRKATASIRIAGPGGGVLPASGHGGGVTG